MRNDPGGVRLYDSLDIPNPQTKQQNTVKTRMSWREILAYGIIGLSIFLGLLLVHNQAWVMIDGYDTTRTIIGWTIIGTMYGCVIIGMFGVTGLGLAHLYNSFQRKQLINVMEHQTTISNLRNTIDMYFDVAGRRADRSVFAGVQNLTYSPHNTVAQSQARVESIAESPVAIEDDTLPVLLEMHRQGLVARSNNSLLIGWSKE